ncbi:glycosyltransferase [Candidatus Gracilibacteria bacterium]|nr:glycosyltransferase [Candidatus Gracilibacteria bacterium]
MKEKINIALTGGGTGGHVVPLAAVYNFLKEENKYSFVWVGEDGGLEQEMARTHKIRFAHISAGKIRRYFSIKNFYEPLKNLTGIFQGFGYISKYKIDIVFSKGGYVSLPLCIAAKVMKKKIYIHESDVKIGLANRLIAKMATKVFYTFENPLTIENHPKHVLSGQILNPELIDYLKNLEVEENEQLTVMVMAGSQGSTRIFENLLNILPQVPDVLFHIVLGDKNMHFRERFKAFPNTLVHDVITQKRLGKILKNIDIAITRGGATSLWELTAFGIHSMIIPITIAGDHQIHNAEYFAQRYGSDILDEKENLDGQLLEKLTAYAALRKGGLNLDNFFDPLQIIKDHIEGNIEETKDLLG